MTHPLVGIWIVEVEDATRSRVTHGFRGDGTVLVTSAFHGAQGVWRATGERSAGSSSCVPSRRRTDRSSAGRPPGAAWSYPRTERRYEMSGSVSRPLPDGGVDERPLTLRGTRLRLE